MNQAEFTQSILAHRRMLFSFILSIVRNYDEAEDLFQDVSMVAMQKCAVFETGTNFGAWIREIARRRIMKAREKSSRRLPALDIQSIEAIAGAHERVDDTFWTDREKALQHCLTKVSEKNRRMLEMRYSKSLSFNAIAEKFQSTVNSIQVILSKVRKSLRKCIESKTLKHA